MQRDSSSSKGAALVEFAILTPLMVGVFLAYYNLLVSSILGIRQEVALTQVELDFHRSPLEAMMTDIDADGRPELDVVPLSGDDITGVDTGLLYQLNEFIAQVHEYAGTGAEYVTNSVATELWYFGICDELSKPCDSLTRGDAFSATRAEGFAAKFFTAPVNADCFEAGEGRDAYISQFDAYVNRQVQSVLTTPATRLEQGLAPLPFGTVLIDVDTKLAGVGRLLSYLRYRPIGFVAQCSLGPQVGIPIPLVKFSTIFFDKQVSKPVL